MAQFLITRDVETCNAIVLGDELTRQAAEANGGVSDPNTDIGHAFDALIAFAQSEIGFDQTAALATDRIFAANMRAAPTPAAQDEKDHTAT